MGQDILNLSAKAIKNGLDKGQIAILITDYRGQIKCCSNSVKNFTGYSPEELVGKHINVIKADKIGKEIINSLLKAAKALEVWEGKLVYKGKSGEHYCAETVIFPVISKEQGYCLIKIGIAEQEKIEEKTIGRQKMEIIGSLTAEIMHEINNILMAIKGQAELLLIKAKKKDANIFQHINSIIMSTERGSKITSQVLTLSKDEKVTEGLDVNQIISSLHENLLHLVGKNVDIRLELANGIHPILADKTNVEQIILNLVLNARDAIDEEGYILIKTEVVDSSDIPVKDERIRPGKYIKISITDSGAGIPEQYLNKIFEPYFTTKPQGTGLGLSIVSNIVKKFDGFINVKSKEKQGTTFEIFFPISEKEVYSIEKIKRSIIGREKILTEEKNILVIEDEKDILEAITAFLEEAGFVVYQTSSLQEAGKILEEQGKIDLIVTDLFLPDGLSVEWVEKKKVKCPVIFCTGHVYKYDEMKTKGYPVLRKPYSLIELLNEITKQLAQEEANP